MGGLDSAAAAVTTAAKLVADTYMAAPADVAAAAATAAAAVGPVRCMDLYGFDLNLWLPMNDTRVYLYLCIYG